LRSPRGPDLSGEPRVDALLEGKRVVICGGPGGVGKTTTSAAVAAGMAARGRKVAVVTIDPARRLADALGLEQLGNEPRRVDPARPAGCPPARAIRTFLRPAGIGGRVIGAGTGVVCSLLRRVTGVDLLEDLSVFFRAMGGMIDDIAERGRHVKALLSDPRTTF